MKNVLKPLAVAVSAAVTIATVPAIASAAPAEAAPAPVSHAQIQQMGQQFRFGSLSQDANTLSVEKGTVRLADNNRGLELVGDNGSVLMTLPLQLVLISISTCDRMIPSSCELGIILSL